MRRILASASPRRKELIEKLGVPFEIIPALGEEELRGEEPPQIVMGLASQKASEVANRVRRETGLSGKTQDYALFVLGADTIVAFQGEILGKPADEADAVRMLKLLSGQVHQVYTGVSFVYAAAGKLQNKLFYEQTDVEFYPMTDAEIVSYVRSGEPMDKAGAYGIQGGASLFVKGIRGDYSNVVGLPVARVYQEMKAEFPKVL